MDNPIHVAVAVIRNNNGQVFITKRPAHVHQGGLWEFPGGKLEINEQVEQALRREIQEENGIEIRGSKPLIRIPHQYPDKKVLLDVWEVQSYSGIPHGKEGQECGWVDVNDLNNFMFPAANQPIISAIQLPPTFLVTPEPDDDRNSFLSVLGQRIAAGQQWLQLRAKTISSSDYNELSEKVSNVCKEYGAKLMLNTSVDLVYSLGAAGLHVTTKQLMDLYERPIGNDKWFSASCHTREEIEHANSIGVDFIFVGSVKQTSSHEDREPIGWEQFSQLADNARMPVYAIGGMTLDDVDESRVRGGQGIAAISALWKQSN